MPQIKSAILEKKSTKKDHGVGSTDHLSRQII